MGTLAITAVTCCGDRGTCIDPLLREVAYPDDQMVGPSPGKPAERRHGFFPDGRVR